MTPILQWQYHAEPLSSLHPDYVNHCLNRFGWQGWELVAISHFLNNQMPIAVFKRQYVHDPIAGAPA